jgi:hypothetical protein
LIGASRSLATFKASSVLAAVSIVTLLVGALENLKADLSLLDLEALTIDGAILTN